MLIARGLLSDTSRQSALCVFPPSEEPSLFAVNSATPLRLAIQPFARSWGQCRRTSSELSCECQKNRIGLIRLADVYCPSRLRLTYIPGGAIAWASRGSALQI